MKEELQKQASITLGLNYFTVSEIVVPFVAKIPLPHKLQRIIPSCYFLNRFQLFFHEQTFCVRYKSNVVVFFTYLNIFITLWIVKYAIVPVRLVVMSWYITYFIWNQGMACHFEIKCTKFSSTKKPTHNECLSTAIKPPGIILYFLLLHTTREESLVSCRLWQFTKFCDFLSCFYTLFYCAKYTFNTVKNVIHVIKFVYKSLGVSNFVLKYLESSAL